MNYSKYTELTIDHQLLKGEEIIEFCLSNPSENIQSLGRFMEEWLHPSPFIQVSTSGSTGPPKVIEIEKNLMLHSASATAKFFNFQKGQSALLCLPISYIAGKMMVVRALYSTLNLVCIEPSLSPLTALPVDQVIDFAPLTPMQLKDTSTTHAVKKILLGGGPIHVDVENKLQSLSAEIYHGYGMTETLSHVALRRVNGPQKSEVYHALPQVNFQLDSRDCLVIEVPFLKENVVTNDIVELINEREFIWKGRSDHVINSGGIKLFPEIIEKKITSFIQERFFVAGLADDLLGEKVCLFIEGNSYRTDQLNALKTQMKESLSKHEIPKEIFFIPTFSETPSGKIQRKKSMAKSE